MKLSAAILFLALCLFRAQAQGGAQVTITGYNEALCGFAPRLQFYQEASEVRDGLSVELLIDEVQANRPATLRFLVDQKPAGIPVASLQVEHEKLMHVIGVRDDLGEFFHIHPTQTASGKWEVNHTFSQAGRYKLWTDVKWRGVSYSFGQQELSVAGKIGPVSLSHAASACVTNSGYVVTLKHSSPLLAGSSHQLEFSLRDQAGNAVTTENFLGAPMHLFTIRDDLNVYLHAHPDHSVTNPVAIRFRQILRIHDHPGSPPPGNTVVRFHQFLPKPGAYKFFLQFRPKNVKLPADQAILAEFYADAIEDRQRR